MKMYTVSPYVGRPRTGFNRVSGSGPQLLDPLVGAQQQHIGRPLGEQSIRYDAGDVIELLLSAHRIRDDEIVDVEDDIAIVGDYSFAINRVAAQFYDLPGHCTASHGNNLNRKRELAQLIDQLAGIGNTDELPGAGGDDFFPGESGAATLD